MPDLDLFTFVLAQDGSAGMVGERTAEPGTPPPAGASQPRSSGLFDGPVMLMFVVMLFVILVLSALGPRRERKRREAMISAVKKHDRVQTVGGVIGAITEVKPDFVVLKVDESSNTRITFAKSAIQQVLSSDPTTDKDSAGER